MSKGESGSWKDDTHWGKVSSDEKQVDYYVGDRSSGKGDHCHMWKEDSGDTGVEHRGACKQCDDEKGSGGK